MKILHYLSSKTEMQVCLLLSLYSSRSHPITPREGPAFTTSDQSLSAPTSSLLAILAPGTVTGLCLAVVTELLAAAACYAGVALLRDPFIPWPVRLIRAGGLVNGGRD